MAKKDTVDVVDVDDDGPEAPPEGDELKLDDAPPDPDRQVVRIIWNGATFVIPKRRGKWPTAAHRWFGLRNNLEGMVHLLGPSQWSGVELIAPDGDSIEAFLDYAGDVIRAQCIA